MVGCTGTVEGRGVVVGVKVLCAVHTGSVRDPLGSASDFEWPCDHVVIGWAVERARGNAVLGSVDPHHGYIVDHDDVTDRIRIKWLNDHLVGVFDQHERANSRRVALACKPRWKRGHGSHRCVFESRTLRSERNPPVTGPPPRSASKSATPEGLVVNESDLRFTVFGVEPEVHIDFDHEFSGRTLRGQM